MSNLTTEMKKHLLEALLKISELDTAITCSNTGICGHVADMLHPEQLGLNAWQESAQQAKVEEEIARLAWTWPKHSGNSRYPVPAPADWKIGAKWALSKLPAQLQKTAAQIIYGSTDNKWDRSTQYGADRWELLEHLIDELREEISMEGAYKGDEQ